MSGWPRVLASVLALILFFSGSECVAVCSQAGCANMPTATHLKSTRHESKTSLPPCHQHHRVPANGHPALCLHSLTIADLPHAGTASFAPHLIAMNILGQLSHFRDITPAAGEIVRTGIFSPPHRHSLSVVVLRI